MEFLLTIEPRSGNLPINEVKTETSTFGKFFAKQLRAWDDAGYKITAAKEVSNNIVLPTDIHAVK